MSRINTLRIINLNYNNNNMKVEDETFDLARQNTLLSLRNGGGKSVMVQMMIAPFVRKRYRDTKDREFRSYFTKTSPTYILTEWLLDDDKTKVLIGMMIRKKSRSIDDDNEDDIEVINFIHEYEGDSKFSIGNIPFVEEGENRRTIKNFVNSKKLFEKLKKDVDIKFNYYDMNVANQWRNYFENLKQYKINHKEWESIIKEINKKESGLSELFSEAKTISGLVEKWFIKIVEDKLNANEGKSKIKKFQELTKKYVYQLKENRHKLNQKEAIEKFKIYAKDILSKAYEFKNTKDNTGEIENKLVNLINYIEQILEDEGRNIDTLNQDIENIENYIKDLEFEKLSFNIYKKEDEFKDINQKESLLENSIKEIENNINKYTHERNIMECAQKYEEYQIASRELQLVENKINILKSKDEETKPERDNIGFTLKNYYLNQYNQLEDNLSSNTNSIEKNTKAIYTTNDNIQTANSNLSKINVKLGGENNKVKSFDGEERTFNDKYKVDFSRNILGFYEDNFENKQNIKNDEDLNTLVKEIETYKLKRINLEEEKNKGEREEKNLIKSESQVESRIKILEDELKKIEDNINKRKDIVKYIDSEESYIFDDNHITTSLENILYTNMEKANEINLKIDKGNESIKKLISGETIELSKDIKEKLTRKDIHIVYGMEWLKKNGLSESKNIKIIKNNPLIPYSLILSKSDIERLRKESIDIVTSYPIPIVERESLEDVIGERENEVFILNKATFLLAFNENLLNEAKLKEMILVLEKRIDKLANERNFINNEIEKYRNLLYYIRENPLTKRVYEELKKDLESSKKELKAIQKNINELKENLKSLGLEIKSVSCEIDKLENNISLLTRKIDEFKSFFYKYEIYINAKEELTKLQNEIKNIVNYLEVENKEKENLQVKLEILKDEKHLILNSIKEIKVKNLEFDKYTKGEIINKDIEDLESRYESLTSEISSDLKVLEEQRKKEDEKYKRYEKQLMSLQNKFKLKDEEFQNVNSNMESQNIVEKEIEELRNLKEEKNKVAIEISHKKGKIESDLEKLYETLKLKLNKLEPKPKELVTDKDFDTLIFIEETNLNKLEQNKIILNSNVNKLESNLNNLQEFKDIEISQQLQFNIDIKDLSDFISIQKRDYRASKEEERKYSDLIYREIGNVTRESGFLNDDLFKKPLDVLLKISEKPNEVIENINHTLQIHELTLEKLSADIDFIAKEYEKIVDILYDYIEEVHINIGKIDQNSTININGKSKKMLTVDIADWEENKSLYKLKTKKLLDLLTDSCLSKLDNNENIEESISKHITTKNLYNEVVSIGSIDVKLYKIEEDRQRIISWEQVCKNSGGEGFLSAFVVLNSLLSFMRKNDTDIFKSGEDSKVLIMDNPFAQTSSEHLLKPLIEMAKKSNTQLICFSGLKGDSIYNRFDNIYVLDLVESRMKNNSLSYLKGNHYKGEEQVQEIISSKFEIKQEDTDQLLLF